MEAACFVCREGARDMSAWLAGGALPRAPLLKIVNNRLEDGTACRRPPTLKQRLNRIGMVRLKLSNQRPPHLPLAFPPGVPLILHVFPDLPYRRRADAFRPDHLIHQPDFHRILWIK